MLAKFITDYALTVVKIRASILTLLASFIIISSSTFVFYHKQYMRNSGIFHILSRVVSQKGLRGFMAGWKIHLLLFPMVMVNMVLANVMFMQLKKLFFPRRLHKGPRSGHGPVPGDNRAPLNGSGEVRNVNGASIGPAVEQTPIQPIQPVQSPQPQLDQPTQSVVQPVQPAQPAQLAAQPAQSLQPSQPDEAINTYVVTADNEGETNVPNNEESK